MKGEGKGSEGKGRGGEKGRGEEGRGGEGRGPHKCWNLGPQLPWYATERLTLHTVPIETLFKRFKVSVYKAE